MAVSVDDMQGCKIEGRAATSSSPADSRGCCRMCLSLLALLSCRLLYAISECQYATGQDERQTDWTLTR